MGTKPCHLPCTIPLTGTFFFRPSFDTGSELEVILEVSWIGRKMLKSNKHTEVKVGGGLPSPTSNTDHNHPIGMKKNL